MAIEIVAIATERLAQAVAIVKHRCDAVETETIELKLLKPVLAV